MYRIVILAFLSLFIIAGCTDGGDVTIKYMDKEPLYFNYKIWGEEDRGYITVMLQYRMGDELGIARTLQEPSRVELDGRKMEADSSKKSGVFYESELPLDSFSGNHSIVFTDSTGKAYKEQFEFIPFSLKTELPEIVHRNGLAFELEGLKEIDFIRIIALDTAFKSRGINEVDTIKNGKVIISGQRLKNLVNGAIHLELFKEEERPVKNGTSAGGSLSITYGIRREFELAD